MISEFLKQQNCLQMCTGLMWHVEKSATHKQTHSLMLKTSGSWPAISMLNHFKW